MIWLTWRQLRAQAVAVYAAVAAALVVLAVTGPRIADLGARATPEVPLYDLLTRTDRNLFFAGIVLMAVAPALVGAFWGAPLVARELETGSYRLVWNQSVTRTRWLAVRLGGTLLAAAAAVGGLTLAVTWWSDPLDGAQSGTQGSLPTRMTPVSFAMRGIVPLGYVVLAVVLGVAAGLVLRRSVPAMAVTLAVFTFLQVAVPLWVRPHLLPPVQADVDFRRGTLDSITLDESGGLRVSVNPPSHGGWILSNETMVDSTGRVAPLPAWFADCLPGKPGSGTEPPPTAASPAVTIDGCIARLARDGYRQRVVYQPADRFWPLQWLETGLYLALAGLVASFCFWRVRRLS
jgi:hypothetical protein